MATSWLPDNLMRCEEETTTSPKRAHSESTVGTHAKSNDPWSDVGMFDQISQNSTLVGAVVREISRWARNHNLLHD